MKVEFELTTDRNGAPVIKFRHLDKDGSLEQTVLGYFVEQAKCRGLKIVNTGGYIDSNGKSYEDYQIALAP